MPTWDVIRKDVYREKAWRKFQDYSAAESEALAPVLMSELAHMLPYYTLAFRPLEDSFQLVTLLSLAPGENWFLSAQGKWLVPYVPAIFRGYPFRLLPTQDGQLVLCVDADSGLVSDDVMALDSMPFFDEVGELTSEVASVLNFLNQCEGNRLVTAEAVGALAEKGLLCPWDIKMQNEKGEPIPVTGLLRVDEEKLNALDGSDLVFLQSMKALQVAYAQLFSMARLKSLANLAQLQTQAKKAKFPEEVNLDDLFGEDDESDFFKF